MSQQYRADIDAQVFAEQVRVLYRSAPRAIPFNVVNPLILVMIFWSAAPQPTLQAWFWALVVISAMRLLHVRHVLHRGDLAGSARSLAHQFAAGSTATALLWGVGFVAVGAGLQLSYQMLFLLTLGGMAAGAFTSMGTYRAGYLLFLGALFVPALIVLLAQGNQLSVNTALLVLLFVGMLAVTQRITYRMWVNGIRASIENEILADRLGRTNDELQAAKNELETLAGTDALTRIPNRRYFEQTFALEWSRARRDGLPIACLMTDIDHFKGFNDRYGHPAGDLCLRRIADVLDAELKRPGDMVARYGGEEFVVLLPETDLPGALTVAERLRKRVAALAIRHENSPIARHVTISVGVTSAAPDDAGDKQALVSAADEALYAAKQQGRNRVVAFGHDTPAGTDQILSSAWSYKA